MKRKRFTEEQIIAVLREHEAGAKAGDVARKQTLPATTLEVAVTPFRYGPIGDGMDRFRPRAC